MRVVALVLGLCACDRVFNFDTVGPASRADASGDGAQPPSDIGGALMTCLADNFDDGIIDTQHFGLTITDANYAAAQAGQGGFQILWKPGQIDGAALQTKGTFDLRGSEVDVDVESFSGDLAHSELYATLSSEHYIDIAVSEGDVAFEYDDGGTQTSMFDHRAYSGTPVHLKMSFDATGANVSFVATTTMGDFPGTFLMPFTAANLSVGMSAGSYNTASTRAGGALFDNFVLKQPTCF